MTPNPIAHRPGSVHDVVRIALAGLIVVCLSSAPFVSLNRWVTRDPLALETWPYVFSYWGAALLGAGLFVLDVVAPMVNTPIARSRALLWALAPVLALGLWALASVSWTTSPARTPAQALLMAIVLLGAVWFGFALSFRQQVLALFGSLHAMTLVSLLAAVGLQSARLYDGSWLGVFANPNTLGPVSALAIVTAGGALLVTSESWMRIGIVALVAIDVVVAFKAESLTGWLAFGGAVAAIVVVLVGRVLITRGVRVVVIRAAGLAIIFGVFGVLQGLLATVANLFGKSSTLTGRRVIWDYVIESVKDRPIAGFGWYSFWDDPAHVAAVYARSYQTIDSAHSTFYETLLFLGGIGLVLLLIVVVVGFGRTWWEAMAGDNLAMAWWASVATFCLLENVTEAMISYHSIFWVLLVAAGFAAASSTRDRARPDDVTPKGISRPALH